MTRLIKTKLAFFHFRRKIQKDKIKKQMQYNLKKNNYRGWGTSSAQRNPLTASTPPPARVSQPTKKWTTRSAPAHTRANATQSCSSPPLPGGPLEDAAHPVDPLLRKISIMKNNFQLTKV